MSTTRFTQKPSQKQEQVLRFILSFKEKHHNSPSIAEIAKELGVAAPTAYQHVQALIKKGYISKSENEARSISINPNIPGLGKMKPQFLSIPVLGAANAGFALINAEEYLQGYLRVASSIIRGRANVFAVRIEGDSMNKSKINGKNIENGDFVIVDPNDLRAKDGDYVLSIIDGNATVKKVKRDKKFGSILLMPESTNPEHKTIYVSSQDNFMINGKIIGVIKK